MLEIVFRPLAETDIRTIADYSLAEWGATQARRYIEAIRIAIERAAEYPAMGSVVEGLGDAYRKLWVEQHRVFCRVAEGQLIVVRVLHKRMDVDDLID